MTREDKKVCAVSDSRLLDELAREGEFVCALCGAKTHSKEGVCEPEALEPDH